MKNNALVEFLASYGPLPSSNNLYDEFVFEASKRTGCAPVEIKRPLVTTLTENFHSLNPKSVILTGTAGDGKTYLARKLVEVLTKQNRIWANTEKVFPVTITNQASSTVYFVKDLSELNESDKDKLYPLVTASLNGEGSSLFVICVNDGHLLKFFRDRESEEGILHGRIANLLQREEELARDEHFWLINMSRQPNEYVVDYIIDAIVNHPDWGECEGCPALTAVSNPCPIRSNLEILRSTEPASIRARLRDLVQLSAGDGRHLSIRQLILLTVNILLGDQQQGRALLTCQTARNRALKEDYAATNPFANVFGDNLGERERRQYGAFSVLNEFGIGFETNNFFDHSLLFGTGELPDHPIYGERIFRTIRESYQNDPNANRREVRQAMVNQRRRLFFSVNPEEKAVRDDPRRDPWNVSAFGYGASYIRLVNALSKPGNRIPNEIRRDLIRGLNRVMTGEMTTTDDCIWLTEPAGVYRGREIPLLVQDIGPKSRGPTFVTFPTTEGNSRAPLLRVIPMNRTELSEDLLLQPTLVECLLRISHGALPASFSSGFRKEIERFQLRAASAIRKVSPPHGLLPKQIELDNGELRSRTVEVMVQEEEW